jgi:cell division transport system ATP-binding protein
MIKFQNVSKIYSSRSGKEQIRALQDVSFEIKEKEFVSIIGRSGAGKTTLFKLLLAQEKPTQGKIFFQGQNVHEIKPQNLFNLRRKIGVVFQNYELFPGKTAYENVAYPMEIIDEEKDKIVKDVREVLEIVNLQERANNFPEELSEGEKQRVAIARALIHRPQIIIADEPTGNLDPGQGQDIIKLLQKIYELGTTIILATHNKEVIDILGKRVITVKEGRIIRDHENGGFIL